MSDALLPHRVLRGGGDGFAAGPWCGESGEAVGVALDWTIGSTVRLTRLLHFDRPNVERALGIAPDVGVSFVAEWSSSTTRYRECAGRESLSLTGEREFHVELPGERIGGVVTVTACLLVDADSSGVDPFVPSLPGAIVWRDSFRFALEGNGSQFPIIALSFETAGLPGLAAWAILVSGEDGIEPDWDAPVAECVQAKLNTGHPLAGRMAAMDPKDLLAGYAGRFLAAELTVRALDVAGRFPPTTAQRDGTYGAFVNGLAARIFGTSPAEAAAYRAADAQGFAARIQAVYFVQDPAKAP